MIGRKGFIGNGRRQIDFGRNYDGAPQVPRQLFDLGRLRRRRYEDADGYPPLRNDDSSSSRRPIRSSMSRHLALNSVALRVRERAICARMVI